MRSSFLVAAAIVLACAPATQRAYVAPTPQTVFTRTEEPRTDPPVHTIYVENRSSVPVVVWSIGLSGCENIKQTCGPRRVNLRVPAMGQVVAMRVEPELLERGFRYRFSFSWRADSANALALAAMASAGDERAQETLDARRMADSLARAGRGDRYRELSRDDFRALAGQAVALRAIPETLTIAPGGRISVDAIPVLVTDSGGRVLGRTRWVRWRAPGSGAVSFSPSDAQIHGRRAGRAILEFTLAEEAQQLIGRTVPLLEVPIVVRYSVAADAPSFRGRVVDSTTKAPLVCTRIALEDSAANVVVAERTGVGGEFTLQTPVPGTYRIRVDLHGWAPVYGPLTTAVAGETKDQVIAARFTEQMLVRRVPFLAEVQEPPRPVAVRVDAVTSRRRGEVPVVQAVTLGGSESMPILGIVTTRVPSSTVWMQFVVDSAGRIDTASIQAPPDAPARAREAVTSAMTRVRFSPARQEGTPVCELMRMQVNFSPR